jgi:hypothetical protein
VKYPNFLTLRIGFKYLASCNELISEFEDYGIKNIKQILTWAITSKVKDCESKINQITNTEPPIIPQYICPLVLMI